ncbi:DUF4260 family protein [Jatrophihabitans lederbergiae]|uniref:DUF4260 family protein n=1 Tax=Jatrophihabitans lederbergiae TaxID=3075547 RepID=UPI0037C0A062
MRGKPLLWLRVEGLSLLAGGIALFATTHQPWCWCGRYFCCPICSWPATSARPGVGAAFYNLGHAYSLPIVLSLIGASDHPHPLLQALGLECVFGSVGGADGLVAVVAFAGV